LFAWDASTSPPVAERRHTRYDPDLGWVNVHSANIPDMYGPGIALRTNARGFRNDAEFGREVPAGKRRVICAGDSFTLGYGVRNGDTWCDELAALDPTLETVNMGQGGYGFDQAYLWYRRDAADLAHDVLVFAFISDDFRRMQHDTFVGYGKPLLDLDAGGELAVRNVPVPRGAYFAPWITRNVKYLKELRVVELCARVASKVGLGGTAPGDTDPTARTRLIVAKVLDALVDLTGARGAKLVLVHLPTLEDHARDESSAWRTFITREGEARGVPVIDGIAELRKLSREDASQLYIPPGAVDFAGAAGHFNEAGNAMAAKLVLPHLGAR
jgi:hypothetical protein